MARTPVIQLRGLRALCICGALPEEQDRRQPYEFDVDIVADVAPATRSDELGDTIDYGGVLARIEAVLEDERIEQVTVEVRKLRPPVPHDLASSGIRLTVER